MHLDRPRQWPLTFRIKILVSAFDTVRPFTLVSKLANFTLPDYLHNWIAHNHSSRQHQTKINGNKSSMLPINASIIQGSAMDHVEYVLLPLICQPSSQVMFSLNMLKIPISWFQLLILHQYQKNYNTYQIGLQLIIWN